MRRVVIILGTVCVLGGLAWFVFGRGGIPPHRVLFPHSGNVVSLALSPDGGLLAAGAAGVSEGSMWAGELKVWDRATEMEVLSQPMPQWVNAVVFSPDGKWLAVGCGRYNATGDPTYLGYTPVSGEVIVYDVRTWRAMATLPHRFGVYAVAFSPDGIRLATAGGEYAGGRGTDPPGEAYLWEVPGWTRRATLAGLHGRVRTLAYSPVDGSLAVGDNPPRPGNEPGWVLAYQGDRSDPMRRLAVQDGTVTHLAVSPRDGSLLVLTDCGAMATLWNLDTGTEVSAGPPFRTFSPYLMDGTAAFSPDGRRLALAGVQEGMPPWTTVSVWDLAVERQVAVWGQHRPYITTVVWCADGRTLITSLNGRRDMNRQGRVAEWVLPR